MENSLKFFLLLVVYPVFVIARVEDPRVTAGSATFENPDAHTQHIRAADKTVIHCKSFQVGKDETVHFIQPDPKARVLCRITGKEASLIDGHLKADGRLFLINPNSIFFRETAQVNVHSLIASTLSISDEDFIQGNFRFLLDKDSKEGAIINRGQITAAQDVVFMAPQITNKAVVKALAGRVAFLGGELITLNFEGDHLISFAIEGDLKTGFIEQAGQIESGKGFLLKLNVADEMIKSVVNVNGVVEASKMEVKNGKVHLVAGSSIAAPRIQAEGPWVETAGDFSGAQRIDISARKDLVWQGGMINGKIGSTEVGLNAQLGTLTFNAPFGKNKEDKATVKTLTLSGQVIDQNSLIKTAGPITYAGPLYLSGDTHAFNSSITFTGPVVIDGSQVKITSGRSKGDIVFQQSLDADQLGRSLTIFNGNQAGTVSFKGTIGSNVPLNLSVETGKLAFFNIGSPSSAGADILQIKAVKTDFFGTVAHAVEQTWETPSLHLKSGQLTTFMTQGKSLVFTPVTEIFIEPQTQAAFETDGGYFELSKLSGEHLHSMTLLTGHGDSKIGEFRAHLGHLHVQSQNIQISGKINAGSIFMEAHEQIGYASSEGKIFTSELLSSGDVTLNAKHGMVGTKDFPILVQAEGKLTVGSKSMAYLRGTCADGFPYVYQKNPPPRMVFNGNETQYVFNEELFMEEEELMSLAPDLFHSAPHGFVDAKNFSFRRAPIYYTVEP